MTNNDTSWVSQGRCKNQPTELFFPEMATREGQIKARLAVAVCKTCDVMFQCRSYAIENEAFGIWGGMTESERTSHRRKYNITVRFNNPKQRGIRFNAPRSVN